MKRRTTLKHARHIQRIMDKHSLMVSHESLRNPIGFYRYIRECVKDSSDWIPIKFSGAQLICDAPGYNEVICPAGELPRDIRGHVDQAMDPHE